VESLSGVVGNLDLVVADVRDVVRTVKAKVDQIDVTGIQTNVLDASKSLKEGLATASARIDEITAKVSEAASNVKVLTADGSTIVKDASADVKEILANLKEISATLQRTIERIGPKVETVLDEVAAAAKTANASIGEFAGLGTKVQGIVGQAGVDLDLALKRIAETSHNLADMTEDLRSHPWKLANRPEDKEIAFENVRNATTNYVRAAQAIQESLTQVRALEGRADLADADRKRLLDALMARLQGELARYEEAARIFTRLLQSPQVQAPR
jgi:methyl-accepting chemotaxis protein